MRGLQLSRQILAVEQAIDLNVESFIDPEGIIREAQIEWETRALIAACDTLRGLKGARPARTLEERCARYLEEYDAAVRHRPPGG